MFDLGQTVVKAVMVVHRHILLLVKRVMVALLVRACVPPQNHLHNKVVIRSHVLTINGIQGHDDLVVRVVDEVIKHVS